MVHPENTLISRVAALTGCAAVVVLSSFLCGCRNGEEDAEAHYNQGVAHAEAGRHIEAIREFKKAVAIKPNYHRGYCDMGSAYGDLGLHAEAIVAFKKAIDLDPDCAQSYCNMGVVYGKLRQYTKGIAACKKAVAIKPDYADAYYNRAAAYYYSRDYDKAWADVKACQKLGRKVNPEFLAELRKASGREE